MRKPTKRASVIPAMDQQIPHLVPDPDPQLAGIIEQQLKKLFGRATKETLIVDLVPVRVIKRINDRFWKLTNDLDAYLKRERNQESITRLESSVMEEKAKIAYKILEPVARKKRP